MTRIPLSPSVMGRQLREVDAAARAQIALLLIQIAEGFEAPADPVLDEYRHELRGRCLCLSRQIEAIPLLSPDAGLLLSTAMRSLRLLVARLDEIEAACSHSGQRANNRSGTAPRSKPMN